MREFISADHHFFHKNIIKYAERYYYSLEEMHNDYIQKHNARVHNDDLVYINGDFGFFKTKKQFDEIVSQLNGQLLFVKGNHDRVSNKIKTHLVRGVLSYGGIQINIVHDPIYADPNYPLNLTAHCHQLWKLKPFDAYYDNFKQKINEIDDNRFKRKAYNFLKKWKGVNRQNTLLINVGVDSNNGYPFSLEEVMAIYGLWKKGKKK